MTVVVVGKNSFLAKETARLSMGDEWLWLSHEDIASENHHLLNAKCVINFSYSPALRCGEYKSENDIDLFLAKNIGKKTDYIMISSRMVYGPRNAQASCIETDSLHPFNAYGQNKKLIEKNLANLLNERLTILRLSNVFGYEPGRNTFFGKAMETLAAQQQIFLDVAPSSVRDFLPVNIFAQYIYKIAAAPVSGIYNLGSGIPVTCHDISTWLIEGYGAGEISVTGSERKGEFFLNVEKSIHTFDLHGVTIRDIRDSCIDCGKELRKSSFRQLEK